MSEPEARGLFSATPSRAAGMTAVVVTMLLWGFSAVAIKAVSTSGLVTACYRLWLTVPLMLVTLMHPSVRRRLDRQWLVASLIGGVLFAMHQSLYFVSLKLTSVTDVTIIGALQPALVLLLARPLFGEPAAPRSLLWCFIAFTGTSLVVLGAERTTPSSYVGDGLAVLNLFAFTGFFLASKRFRQRLHAWDYVVGMTTVSAVVVLVLAVATNQEFTEPSAWEWVTLVLLAWLSGTLGHVLTNWAHASVPAFVSSMILLAVPIVAAGAAHLVLGERITALQLCGAAVVVASIAVIVRSTQKQHAELAAEAAVYTEAP
jgi:drug/metabolite transporter (DMT)-like permease